MNLAVVEREEVGVAVERGGVKGREKEARCTEPPVRGGGGEAIPAETRINHEQQRGWCLKRRGGRTLKSGGKRTELNRGI